MQPQSRTGNAYVLIRLFFIWIPNGPGLAHAQPCMAKFHLLTRRNGSLRKRKRKRRNVCTYQRTSHLIRPRQPDRPYENGPSILRAGAASPTPPGPRSRATWAARRSCVLPYRRGRAVPACRRVPGCLAGPARCLVPPRGAARGRSPHVPCRRRRRHPRA